MSTKSKHVREERSEQSTPRPRQEAMAKTTTAEKTSSNAMMDKLAEIDREIQTLHDFCVKRGLSEHEIRKSASPLLNHLQTASRKKLLLTAGKVAALLVLAVSLLYCDPAYSLLCVIGRKLEIKVCK